MIEVKNLKKTYVTKSTTTHALDDVSIKFPEKGLVFLLGKSGSGKSTLLNSIGGLDTVDSGEIIIMGRSSSTFSGSDFDSYRNTFVGFIFQEYNILNEFTVEDNIALALELQGKKSNKGQVQKLLEQVDLKGFEKRKPNTLSGGQKQRIAIARALIKEPKIIMADEPTGALDSKTGKQVFDTLKKLSQEKLVIVVSHDREFAEIYGDRIIELKDGKIISDESKVHVDPKAINENISVIGNETLSIKDVKNLSFDDKVEIMKFIESSENNIIISANNNDISSFKKANRISDDDKTEVFEKTGDIQIGQYDEKERKFIKSKLPLGKAIKMGLSSLKVKPFRLVITMLLTIVSFTLFGVASTLMDYNSNTVTKNSFNKSDYHSLEIQNYYQYDSNYYVNDKLDSTYTSEQRVVFNENDLNRLRNKYGPNTLAVYSINSLYSSDLHISNLEIKSNTPKTLQINYFGGFATPFEGSKYEEMIQGSLPTNLDEVAISEYYANVILKSKLTDPDNSSTEITVNNINDLINKVLKIRITDSCILFLKITGIYKIDSFNSKYDNYYDENEVNTKWDNKKIDDFKNFMDETPSKIFFITKEMYNKIIELNNNYNPKQDMYDYGNNYFEYSKTIQFRQDENLIMWYNSVKKKSEHTLDIRYFRSYNQNDEGIILPADDYMNLLCSFNADSSSFNWDSLDYDAIKLKIHDLYFAERERQLELIYEKLNETQKQDFNNRFLDYFNYETQYNYYNYLKDYDSMDDMNNDESYNDIRENYNNDRETYWDYTSIPDYDYVYSLNYNIKDFYISLFDRSLSPYNKTQFEEYLDSPLGQEAFEMYLNVFDSFLDKYLQIAIDPYGTNMTISRKIIGIYFKPKYLNTQYGLYIDDNDYELFRLSNYSKTVTKYEFEESDSYYKSVFVDTNSSIFNDLKKVSDNDTLLQTDNSLYSTINSITELIEMLKDVFFYVGLVLAIFSALLLFNFITVSISSKAHEIGVLRAVGARGKDVFKIFFSESLFIALLSFTIALIAAFVLVFVLNDNLSSRLSFELVLLTFGPLSIALMLGIALAVALVGTFIPVLHISRKKPVDSLRSQ